jgi:hypothetical protein
MCFYGILKVLLKYILWGDTMALEFLKKREPKVKKEKAPKAEKIAVKKKKGKFRLPSVKMPKLKLSAIKMPQWKLPAFWLSPPPLLG